MSEIFKTKVESPVEPETASQDPIDLKSDELAGNETKTQEEPNIEENKLDIWEGLNRRKYGVDLFNIRATHETFPISAQFTFIDKFIKGEIEERQYEKNTKNYDNILKEFEAEAGTENLETYKRLSRLFEFIKVVKKYREIKKKKELYTLSNSTLN